MNEDFKYEVRQIRKSNTNRRDLRTLLSLAFVKVFGQVPRRRRNCQPA